MRAAFPGATILRPSVVFGPEDQFFNRFAGMAAVLPFMPVVSGATKFQPVYVGDVADAVMAAITRDDAAGRIYELGGPRAMSMREVLRIRAGAHPPPPPPGGAAGQAGRASRRGSGRCCRRRRITRDQLILLGRDNLVAEGALGLADLGHRGQGGGGDRAGLPGALPGWRVTAAGLRRLIDPYSDLMLGPKAAIPVSRPSDARNLGHENCPNGAERTRAGQFHAVCDAPPGVAMPDHARHGRAPCGRIVAAGVRYGREDAAVRPPRSSASPTSATPAQRRARFRRDLPGLRAGEPPARRPRAARSAACRSARSIARCTTTSRTG